MIDTTTHVQMANPANAFLESAQPLFINGAPQAASNPTPIIDPSHDKILLNLGQASGRDVDRAVEAAQKALVHPDWARMPPGERALALMRWAELIERNGGVIAELETRNSGIPIALTRHMAVPLSASLLRYYAGWTTKMGGEVSLPIQES